MFHVDEKYRLTKDKDPLLGSNSSWGRNGSFTVPHPRITDYLYYCQVSDGRGWEHVSISLHKIVRKTGKAFKNLHGMVGNPGGVYRHREIIYENQRVERCPTWEEMCYIKSLFWDDTDCVIEFHPAKADYVSCHPYCLHLWRPTDQAFPTPDPIMVGPASHIKQ